MKNKYQLNYFANIGYRVVAPDMRGYVKTAAPKDVDEYDVHKITDDIVGVLDVLVDKNHHSFYSVRKTNKSEKNE